MDEALKPCPFCGNDGSGPIEHALHVSHTQNDWHSAYDCYSVQCDKCTVSMGYSDNEAEAIAAWNTRADAAPTPNAEVVEAVGFAMWKAEADRAAPNVGKNRAIENYRYDLDPIDRAKWDQIAQAAIAALDAARGGNPESAVNDWLSECTDGRVSEHTILILKSFARWLYAHHPRGDQVARVVEWLRNGGGTDISQLNGSMQMLFLEGMNRYADAIERGEPFNG